MPNASFYPSYVRVPPVAGSGGVFYVTDAVFTDHRNKHARLSPGVVAGFVSRVLLLARVASRGPAVIPLGRASPRASCGLPRSSGGQPSNAPLRGLAPDGVCRAALVAERAVGSYSTFSPLPRRERRGGLLFCGTFLEVTLTGRYPASCPMEPGLSSRRRSVERSPEPLRPGDPSTRFERLGRRIEAEAVARAP